jgi:F-type H+-transporting ATPase subunit b
MSTVFATARRGAARILVVLALTVASAPALAVAQSDDEGAAAEHAGGEHEGGLRGMFSNTSFLAALVNFGLLIWILRKFGREPLSKFLVARRDEMAREMSAAAEMKAKAEAVFKEYTARLAQLDTELAKLRSDIERGADEDKQRIVADAEENTRRLKRETESLIDQYGKQLSASVRREMVEAAVAAAEKILRENIGDADQQRLAERYDERIKDGPRSDVHALRGDGEGRAEKAS